MRVALLFIIPKSDITFKFSVITLIKTLNDIALERSDITLELTDITLELIDITLELIVITQV